MAEPIRLPLVLAGDRRAYRDGAVMAFLNEAPGIGTGDLTSRHIYTVEQTASGHSLELYRPAYLNKGMDFTVRCLTIVFNDLNVLWRHVPRHDDLAEILISIRTKYPNQYPAVRAALQRVYDCGELPDLTSLADLLAEPRIIGTVGCPADLAVLIARWLFVEQDVTYWHNSGRAKLYREVLKANGLV